MSLTIEDGTVTWLRGREKATAAKHDKSYQVKRMKVHLLDRPGAVILSATKVSTTDAREKYPRAFCLPACGS